MARPLQRGSLLNSPYRTPEEPPSAWSSWNEEWERARIEANHAEKRASLVR